MGDWSVWSAWSKSCGGASRTRTREIDQQPGFGGKQCGSTEEHGQGEQQKCPVDCAVSLWDEWSDCDKTCSMGSRTRSRTIRVTTLHGGAACPELSQTQACNDGPCPIHCQVTPFGAWSDCTLTCGSGTATRSRSVVSKAINGGYTCPFLDETRECNTDPCPLDCVVGQWGGWSTCTKTCGTGVETRARAVTVAAQSGGAECPITEEKRDCNTQQCAANCVVSRWSEWTDCSKTCAAGSSTRQRSVTTPDSAGGIACPSLSESKPCNDGPCPVHCKVSDFGPWGRCTKTCGLGTKRRTRTVLSHATHNGYVCPHLSEKKDCVHEECPIDCLMREFGGWSACDKTCGSGSQTKTREIRRPPENGGVPCPSTTGTRNCNTQNCPADCAVSEWSNWRRCTKTCGGGSQKRYRTVTVHAAYEGVPCPALMNERKCNAQECPIDCVVSAFGDWGRCTKSCNAGSQTREREIVTSPIFGGKICPELTETQGCNAHACPVACVVSAFSAWTDCSLTCGTGQKVRTRSVLVEQAAGGMKCPNLVARTNCNAQPCPTDCVTTKYSAWTECDASCNTGKQSRSRSITQEAAFGGKACPGLEWNRKCNEQKCPVPCKLSHWEQWSHCSQTCSAGFQARTRTVVSDAQFGGEACGDLEMTQACNNGPCPLHCNVSPFGDWSTCTLTCGTGSQTRSRDVISKASNGGYTCPFLSESRLCNTVPCAVDCAMSEWTDFSVCTTTCGTGYQIRTRTIITPAANGGKACKWVRNKRNCNEQVCAEDCTVSEWGDWTTCTKSCGTGSQTRSRSVDRDSAYGGKQCPGLSGTRECNSFACPVDCTVTKWEQWSLCSNSCGGGIQSRSRKVALEYSYGGKSCPHLAESQACMEDKECPVDCVVSAFGPWTSCSKSCADESGAGTQTQQREATTSPQAGGKACPALEASRSCSTKACPADCELGAWGEWTGCAVKCGGGLKSRTRPVLREASVGGKQCGVKEEKKECNSQGCTCAHVYCAVQPGSKHIKVMHHKLEWAKGGRKHRCKFNYDTQNCECMCYNDVNWKDVTAYDTKRPCSTDTGLLQDMRLHEGDRDPSKEVGHLTFRGVSEVGVQKPCEDTGSRSSPFQP